MNNVTHYHIDSVEGGEMEGRRKIKYLDNNGHIDDRPDEDELDFLLWKSELNSELLSFWKSMTES
jgi:hypothetical protein